MNRMHRWTALVALGVGAACAKASTTGERSVSQTAAAYMPGAEGQRMGTGNGVMISELAAPLTQVWWALPEAYDSLGVALTLIDHPRHTLGNEGLKIRAKLGGTRLSTYFECGNTQGGPSADSYDMFITLVTQLDSIGPEQTRIVTSVSGAARPLQFAQDYSRCTSKGTLEKQVLAVIKAKLKP